MKIDCPHCGVHGSVDNSLLKRKLRCPKCSKVFLVTEDILPEMDDTGMLSQEILYDDEPQSLESDEQGIELHNEAGNLQACSACGQFFAPEFLEEVDLKLYCALCRPELEEESLDLLEEDDAEDSEDDRLEIMDEESSDDESGDVSADEDDGFLGLMDDESDDDELEINPDDELEDDLKVEEDSEELEKCSGCGELLHPDFLETVGSERYCALCAPEEDVASQDETGLELKQVEEVDVQTEEESIEIEIEDDSSVQALMDDDVTDETEEEIVAVAEDAVEEDEDQEGYPKEPCSVCGEEFHRDFMQEIDSKLYCGVCQPEVIEEESKSDEAVLAGVGAVAAATGAVMATDGDDEETDVETPARGTDFTVGELIKEAWQKTKGVKAAIWGAVIAMCLIIFAISFGGIAAFQGFYKGTDPTITMGANGVVQLVANWLSMLMTGGIMLIGVRHALEQRVSWKMVFAGFSKALSITVALILQTILIVIGFILLVIPGIYLSVGYALVLPLILDKGMGPWEALEASRKAIHKKWWTVFGLYLVMLLLYAVSAIPLGLGLIWTVPMFFVLIGVLYVRLFGSDEILEEDPEEELEDELEEELSEETEEEIEELEEVDEKVEEELEAISEEIEPKQ